MKVKLQEYAFIAEILGGVAIVISLLFVGLQITDGNREARAATTQSALDAEMYFLAQVVNNADVWEKVVIGGDMSDQVETRKAIALFNMLVTQSDNAFQMQKSGYIVNSEINIIGLAAPNFVKIWRQSPGAKNRSPEFLELIDSQMFQE